MLTLGIETSTRDASISLVRDGRCIAERSLQTSQRRHAQTLVAQISEVLRENALRPADLNLVAVSVGPGSFTGLRIGVVCAKTLAYSLRCNLVGVDSFLGVAQAAPSEIEQVAVISDAQRGDLYLGRYSRSASGWFVRDGEIQIVSLVDFSTSLTPLDAVIGVDCADQLAELQGHCRVLPADVSMPQARHVAQVGAWLLSKRGSDDPWSLEPVYLRKSAAEDKWEAGQLPIQLRQK